MQLKNSEKQVWGIVTWSANGQSPPSDLRQSPAVPCPQEVRTTPSVEVLAARHRDRQLRCKANCLEDQDEEYLRAGSPHDGADS